MIDWQLLLLKYIDLVGEAEGIDFISHSYRTKRFSDEEWAALTLAAEVAKEKY